jgi:hypothetical protein
MGFATFRVGHAGAHKNKNHKTPSKRADPNASCSTGGFYTSPSNGATVPSMDPLVVSWDPTCLSTSLADMYLFSPGSTSSRIHVWRRVPFAPGTYTAQLMPRWWNATAAQSLQLAIVPTDTPPFMTQLPAGPVFTATYTPPPTGAAPPPEADSAQFDSGITDAGPVHPATKPPIGAGKTAAAVLLPLLFLALLAGAYLKWQRGKAQQQRRRFSHAVDKRMSTISTDWKSMSPAGAAAAIRHSIAADGSAAFGFGGIRPLSGAVVGAEGDGMMQVRTGTGVGLRGVKPAGERVSRVSFAADTRVSRVSFADTVGEGRRTRAFHSAYIPPLPTREEGRGVSAASAYPDSVEDVKPGMCPSPSPCWGSFCGC